MLCQRSVFKLFQWFESRYRYVMELNMPGWIVSPRSLNNHITAPQQTAANMENWRESGGTGLPGAAGEFEYGDFARARKEDTTREQTYNTIWMTGRGDWLRMALVNVMS